MKQNKLMILLGIAVIGGGCFIAYKPAMRGPFLWDDMKYVVNNELLTAPDGLWRIWFSTDVPSQYFPLVYTTFRFERQIADLNPILYHADNVALHVISALLIWLILSRLEIPGSFWAAAIFALHPVNAESVAWISERKNTLMLVFACLSALFFIEFAFRSPTTRRAAVFYVLSLLCFMLSLFSKTTACVLPAVFVLILWLKGVRFSAKRILQLAPYFVLGVAMGLLTMWWEHYHQGMEVVDLGLDPLQKTLIATHALWFYAGKIFWPINLAFSYPRWKIDTGDAVQYIWLAGCVLAAAALIMFRRRLGRGVIVGILFFVVTLLPMSGIFQLYTFIYTWVADHYVYMSTIGLIALVTAGVAKAAAKYPRTVWVVAAIVLVSLGALTRRQAWLYGEPERIWRDTLEKNPDSWLAHNNLGQILLLQDNLDEAISHISRSLELAKDAPVFQPYNIAAAHFNIARSYRQQKKNGEAIIQLQEALKITPNDAEAHFDLGDLLESQDELTKAADQFAEAIRIRPDGTTPHYRLGRVLEKLGNITGAIKEYHIALDIEPANVAALELLVGISATRDDPAIKAEADAIPYAKRAVEKTHSENPIVLNLLAMSYASNGKLAEAIMEGQRAMEIASAAGARELAEFISRQIDTYAELLKQENGTAENANKGGKD
jgi:tetratricopeptide (TPR) repeat protein